MEIYAPSYCEKFKCKADKCTHSCCIDWEIDIDERTYEKYKALNTDFSKDILKNVENDECGAHFSLDKNGRCKNLDERGLCKIITELGEGYLCDICRLHPRFFNTVGGVLEMGLGLSCEEAVRLALEEKGKFTLVKIGEEGGDEEDVPQLDVRSLRECVVAFFENTEGGFLEKLNAVSEKYGVRPDLYAYDEWIEFLLSLEILDGEWRALLSSSVSKEPKVSSEAFDSCYENLFKYLVYRHVSVADTELSFLSRLAFAVLSAMLVKSLAEREEDLTKERLFEIVRLFSSEIEYSEENTENLIFEIETKIM